MTQILNAVSISLFVVGLVTIGLREWRLGQPPSDREHPFGLVTSELKSDDLPDIYFIVLDGYGRGDILQESYDHDNQQFLESLRRSGFLIIDDARANYPETILSLASSLNLDYLQSFLPAGPELRGQSMRLEVQRWLWHNQFFSLLRELGYSIITFDSGYRPTAVPGDLRLSTPSRGTNLYERAVIDTSALTLLQQIGWMPDAIKHPGYDLHRERIEFTLQKLESGFEPVQHPRFIFAHLLVPHPPFVFDSTGQPRQPGYSYTLLDGGSYPGDPELYQQEYRAQLQYLNRRLRGVVDKILARRERPTMIILLSDHGPRSQLGADSSDRALVKQQFAILLAIRPSSLYKPDPDRLRSPINLMRWTISSVSQIDLPSLSDRSYHSRWEPDLEFEPVPSDLLMSATPLSGE